MFKKLDEKLLGLDDFHYDPKLEILKEGSTHTRLGGILSLIGRVLLLWLWVYSLE